MNADLDLQEVARLIDRARDLLLLHRESNAGVGYFLRQWPRDAQALRNMARIERESRRWETRRLFA
jgi:hypothetical protein